MSTFFLDIAARIARRLVKDAPWDGVGGTLYEGTAGIALFLAECHHRTGDPGLWRAAEEGLRRALAYAAQAPPNDFGFFSGKAGIAYAAFRIAHLLDAPEHRRAALTLLATGAGHEARDLGTDVMDGAAGAIPALLRMAEWSGEDFLVTMAEALGERLIAIARREPVGWSWGSEDVTALRNHTGFARGASGMGHAFTELFAWTGKGRYAYAAGQAFAYERQFFDPQAGVWLDVRHLDFSKLLYWEHRGREGELALRLARGEAPPEFQPIRQWTWCYGASGIALSRLRAAEILGGPVHGEEARTALRSCLDHLPRIKDASLCHGGAGTADALLAGAEASGDRETLSAVANWARRAAETHELAGKPWPCGTEDQRSHPSLMLGEAGIGYFFLRLADPSIPCLLRVSSPGRRAEPSRGRGYADLRRGHTWRFFSRTLRAVAAHPELAPCRRHLPRSEPVKVYEAVLAFLDAERGSEAAGLLEDVFAPERWRFETLREIDFTQDTVDALCGSVLDPDDPETVFELRPETRLLQPRWDWDAWLAAPRELRPPRPDPLQGPLLLYRGDRWAHINRPSERTVRILERLGRGAAPAERLTEELGIEIDELIELAGTGVLRVRSSQRRDV